MLCYRVCSGTFRFVGDEHYEQKGRRKQSKTAHRKQGRRNRTDLERRTLVFGFGIILFIGRDFLFRHAISHLSGSNAESIFESVIEITDAGIIDFFYDFGYRFV